MKKELITLFSLILLLSFVSNVIAVESSTVSTNFYVSGNKSIDEPSDKVIDWSFVYPLVLIVLIIIAVWFALRNKGKIAKQNKIKRKKRK